MLFNQNLLTPPTDGATEGGNGFRYRVMTKDNNKEPPVAIKARDDSKHNNINLPTGLFLAPYP